MGQLMGMLGGGQGVGPFVRQDHQSGASGTEQQNTSSASGRPPVPGQSTSAPFNLVNPMQMFLHQLINNLGAGGGQFQVQIQQGPDGFQIGPMLHGNPGDYAWGPNGIDQIVTQLLNQFEGSSQPMSEEDIAKLPTVNIDQETVDKSTQCATCFENFKLEEPVRQLACLHVFHDECIIPWLRNVSQLTVFPSLIRHYSEENNSLQHSTCPICRMSFEASARAGAGSQRQDSTTLQGGAVGGLQGLFSTVAAAFGGNRNTDAAPSAQTQSQLPSSAPASTSSVQQQQSGASTTTTSSSRPATGEQRDIVDQIDELD